MSESHEIRIIRNRVGPSGIGSGFETRSCGNFYCFVRGHRDGSVLLPSYRARLCFRKLRNCRGIPCLGFLHSPYTV
jgi:hypothetical protein